MYELDVPSPGSQESIAPNRYSKFDQEHTFFYQIKIFVPMGLYMDQNLNLLKKRVPGRILNNGLAQWIPESLEKVHPVHT